MLIKGFIVAERVVCAQEFHIWNLITAAKLDFYHIFQFANTFVHIGEMFSPEKKTGTQTKKYGWAVHKLEKKKIRAHPFVTSCKHWWPGGLGGWWETRWASREDRRTPGEDGRQIKAPEVTALSVWWAGRDQRSRG